MSYQTRFRGFVKSTAAVERRPIALPHPGENLRELYNNDLNTLIMAIGVEASDGVHPRHFFWPPNENINSFKSTLDREGVFSWLSGTFDFSQKDRGVGLETPLLELVLRFEGLLNMIAAAPDHRKKGATIKFEAHITGPLDVVERIEREVDNAMLWAFLSALKTETVSLGGTMVLTYRGGRPYIGIQTEGEILSFFEVPYLPIGPNGEELDLPYEPEQERHI